MPEAKLQATLELNGKGFHKTMHEAHMEVRSFEKDVHFLSQGMGLAFGVKLISEFGNQLKELRKYQTENGIEIVSTETLDHLDAVGAKLEETKMRLIGIGATISNVIVTGIQEMAAGFASGFNLKIMQNAASSEDNLAESTRNLNTAMKDMIATRDKFYETGMSEDKLLEKRKEHLKTLKAEQDALEKIVVADIRGGASKRKTQEDQTAYTKKEKEVFETETEIHTIEDKVTKTKKKEKEDRAKIDKRFDTAEHKMEEEKADKAMVALHKKHEEEAKEKKRRDIQSAERGYQLDDAAKHIGFQQQQGGAYSGLVATHGGKEMAIAERQEKLLERLCRIAEEQIKHDKEESIRNQGSGVGG